MSSQITVGNIVKFRNRLWRIEEYNGKEISAIPLDSSTSDRRRFLVELEDINNAEIEKISDELVGDVANQKLLLRAFKFDLLHSSAPFISLQRSSVIPYNYQFVPLVVSMERLNTRLLIADDVGLGKTIEAGLIISELLNRGIIKKILILTPPSLKEQWMESLDYFFHINTTIISSFSRKEFEKDLPPGVDPWSYYDICIASLDYAKNPEIKLSLLNQKWDLLLVDEIHSCARPHYSELSKKQMMRYELVKELSKNIRNILFLTATPHNGYSDCFASILEMINSKIVTIKDNEYTFDKKEAKFNVVQRNRKQLEEWYIENKIESPFPKRNQIEIDVIPGEKISNILSKVGEYGNSLIDKYQNKKNILNSATWVALHFQRRSISSPFALGQSIENRLETHLKSVTNNHDENNDSEAISLFLNDCEPDERFNDELIINEADKKLIDPDEKILLENILQMVKNLKPEEDTKLQNLINEVIPELFTFDNKIILFTKYTDTLKYLEKNLVSDDYEIFTLHGDISFVKRKEIFLNFEKSKKAILISTDVISEGMNLQRLSSNMIHYELPWNPNRLEQRNGRIDRIGQKKSIVQIRTYYYKNSIEDYILDLLIRKSNQIRKDRGYSGNYFGDENYIVELIKNVHLKTRKRKNKIVSKDQIELFPVQTDDAVEKAVAKSFRELYNEENIKKIESESFYDVIDISLPEIDKRIDETRRIIGTQLEIKSFVFSALNKLNCGIENIANDIYRITINDSRLYTNKNGQIIDKATFIPEIGIDYPDVIVLDLGHPFIRKLVEVVKSGFYFSGGFYGRGCAYFSSEIKSVTTYYNVLLRFISGKTDKRIIEELITFGVNSFTEMETDIPFENIKIAETTQKISPVEYNERVKDALNNEIYFEILKRKTEKRKNILISERKNLIEKIEKPNNKDNLDLNWLYDSLNIELISSELLSISIVLPLNP